MLIPGFVVVNVKAQTYLQIYFCKQEGGEKNGANLEAKIGVYLEVKHGAKSYAKVVTHMDAILDANLDANMA